MFDERLARLEREARAGSDFAAEARDELRAARLAYGQQLELTREVIVRNGELFTLSAEAWNRAEQKHEAIMQRLTEMGEEIRTQTKAIWKVIDRMDRLDGGTSPA